MRVSLRKIKSIERLDFEVPGPGVWILTGWNGSGKSTLLAALYRLGFNAAFQWYFKAGTLTSSVDRYEESEVEYEIDGERVTYRYGGQRWRANPRKNAELVSRSGYTDVLYLEANANRIEPHQREIKSNRVYACAAPLLEFMEYVLGDEKWRDLKYVYTSRGGRGKLRAYLIQHKVGVRNRYFSEKNFSLGELCVLRLALKVLEANRDSLLLIDEVEMALHPEAQMRLMERIRDIASAKRLTVIFSTHSATIIKHCNRESLIYLQSIDGDVKVTHGAYPARVLGDISSAGELSVDFLFYVEDEQAKVLLERLIERFYSGSPVTAIPRVRIVPVGGYPEVLNMLANTNGLIPSYVKRAAFLDLDAQASMRAVIAARTEPLFSTHARVADNVHYLPWTPEVGLTGFLEGDVQTDSAARAKLVEAFATSTIRPDLIASNAAYSGIETTKPRLTAKKRLSHFSEVLATASGLSVADVTRRLYGVLVEWKYRDTDGPLRTLLGPELNRRR
jgi:Uncharacterized conserved protein